MCSLGLGLGSLYAGDFGFHTGWGLAVAPIASVAIAAAPIAYAAAPIAIAAAPVAFAAVPLAFAAPISACGSLLW